MAITAWQPKRGSLIHHSDRGVQYACIEYTDILAVHDIQPSAEIASSAPPPGRRTVTIFRVPVWRCIPDLLPISPVRTE